MFDIRSDEKRLVWILFLFSFLLGIPRYFTNTASDALFLAEYGAENLPFVYIGFAVFAPLASIIYANLAARLRLGRLLVGALSLLLLMLAGFWLLFVLVDAPWPALAFAIWFWVLWVISSIIFWSAAGRLFNVRQAKRLFGLIGSGEIAAAVVGGIVITPLINVAGTVSLLFVGLLGGIGALILLFYLLRWQPELNALPSQTAAPQETQRAKAQKGERSPYVLLIFTVSFLAVAAYMLLDNTYYALAEVQFPDERELASFIGVFFAAVGFGSFLTKLLFDAPFLRRFGVRGGIIALPLTVLTGTTLAIVLFLIGGTNPAAVSPLFWVIVVTKLVDRWVRDSMDKTSLQALYQPLPTAQRLRTLTQVEGIVEPLAAGTAGLGILLLSQLFTFAPSQLLYALLLVAVVWLVAGIILGRRHYPAMLARALRQRRWMAEALTAADASSIQVLQRALQSKDPGAALYAMNSLAAYDPQTLLDNLPLLLEHDAAVVRLEALHTLERLSHPAEGHSSPDLSPVLLIIQQMIATEPAADVRGVAIQTYALLGEPEQALEEIRPYLNDPQPLVQRGAMVGLFRGHGIEGVLAAGERLLSLASSADGRDRLLAAQVLAGVGDPSFYRPLARLLQDPELSVRHAALLAAGQVKNPRLWPAVVEQVMDAKTSGAASVALRAGGESAVPSLVEALAQYQQQPETLLRLVAILKQIDHPQAAAALADQLDHPNLLVRTHTLQALGHSGQGEVARDVIEAQITAEAEWGNWLLATQEELKVSGAYQNDWDLLIGRALDRQSKLLQQRLVALLALHTRNELILSLGTALNDASGEKRAYALETFDITMSAALKPLLLPLLRRLSEPGRAATPPGDAPNRLERLHALVEHTELDDWTRACALFALVANTTRGEAATTEEALSLTLPLETIRETAERYQQIGPPLLRETAVWALACLNGLAARQGSQTEKQTMLTTIERVIFLRGVELFRAVPDYELARVAEVVRLVELQAGEQFITQGEQDQSLYIIVDGQADVVRAGAGTVATRGAKEVIGEMALLSNRPRTADVVAATETTALKIEQADFQAIMEASPELSQGIIQVLVDRLEEVLQRETALQQMIEGGA